MADKIYKMRIKKQDVEIDVEGDKKFVEKHIEKLKKEIFEIEKKPSKETGTISFDNKKGKLELEKLTLPEFYKQKNPNTHDEACVVFAYWLTKKEKKSEFKIKDISGCFKNANIPKPTNVRQHVVRMASGKKAYLAGGGGKGMYKLTLFGEEFVEKQLPKIGKK